MITVHDVEQGTDEWLELRKDLYTGSNAHKLLKHSGQMKIVDGVATPYAVSEITGFTGNFYTRRGHLLEDEALELYEQIKKCTVDRVGFVTNSKFPSCGYSPDGLRSDRTVEVKAFNKELQLQILNGDVPIKILAQCHFGMLICDKKLCDLIFYNPKLDAKHAFKVMTIRWNPKIAANLKRILAPQEVTA